MLYNYSHYDNLISSGETFDMTPTNRYNSFSQLQSRRFAFSLTQLPFEHCRIRETFINREHGSSYDNWLQMGGLELSDPEDLNYLQQTFRYPTEFTTLLYASQMLQAEAIKYGVEHFRRNRGRCMGAIYWQLNDCWPVASWASVDYWGRWKALHYYAKRFFAPVMVSCEEQGWMSAAADMNREHFDFEKSIRLNVTNETLQERKILVKWALRNADSSIVKEEEEWVDVAPLSSVWLEKKEFPNVDYFTQYVSYEGWENNVCISEGSVIFSYPKYFRYQNPNLSYRVEGDEIVITADAYAKGVEILNENEDLILSDNYFDMNAGEKRVKILGYARKDYTERTVGDVGKLRLRAVYHIR